MSLMTPTIPVPAPGLAQSAGCAGERLFRLEDLPYFPSELPSGPVRYELDNGRLITMAPAGDFHGAVEANLTGELKYQGQLRGLGKARCGEVSIVLRRDPDRVVGADVAFIASASLPLRRTSEGYLLTIPDLVAEIRSPNDTLAAMQRKMEEYLAAGVKVVWLLDPGSRTVTEHRKDVPPRVFTETEMLVVPDIIPGFQTSVAELFQD